MNQKKEGTNQFHPLTTLREESQAFGSGHIGIIPKEYLTVNCSLNTSNGQVFCSDGSKLEGDCWEKGPSWEPPC